MAYRADIEIAVRGAQDLKRLQNQIKSSSDAVDNLNSSLNDVANLLTRSFNNINKVVGEAADNLNKAALGTKEASDAARGYYEANKTLNNALRERLKLLGDIQKAERGTVLANIKASQAAREASGFSAFSAGIDIPTQKSIRRNREKRALAEAAAETANQIQKLADRQEEFTLRTDDAAQAAARQTAAFYRQLRVAKEVAKINAAAGPAQLLLAPAAPGAPAMGGGARRRITGAVERLGGARTADEAAATLRLAQATDALAQSSNKIDPQYNRFLPDAAALNATGRGIQRLTTDQQAFNEQLARGIRFNEKYTQELERRRRLGIDTPTSNRMPGTSGRTGGPFPMAGPIPLSQYGQTRRTAASSALGATLRQRAGGALGNAAVGGAFPLLFGQGAGAATGGAIGGLIGGAFGGIGGFAGSLIGTVIGDIAAKGDKVRQLAEDIGFSAEQTKLLEQSFKQAGREFDKFEASVQAIRGVGLAINDQASAIQAASQLAETYGGKIDKITSAFAAALSSGKVTQATLNQLTKQGIPIQEKLAATYGVSRSELLAMAKAGEISVQQLSDAFVSLANEASTGASAIPSAYETASRQIQQSVNELVSRVSAAFNVQTDNMASAFDNAVSRIGAAVSQLINRFAPLVETIAGLVAGFINLGTQAASALLAIPGYVDAVVNAVVLMIPGLSSTLYLLERIRQITGGGKNAKTAADYGRYAPGFMQQAVPEPISRITAPSQAAAAGGTGGKGAKGPEDRTNSLLADLEAITKIAATENLVRDLMFEGRDVKAAEVEIASKLYDIERDRIKALESANFESEKDVINKIAAARAQAAQLELEDKIRDITSQRFAEELNAQQAVRDSVKVFTDIRKEQELQAQYGKTYLRLVTEGMLPAEAERIANFEKLVTQQLSAVAEQLKITDAAILEAKARGASTVELEKQLKALKAQQEAIKEEAAKGPGKAATPTERLQDAIATARGELNNLTDPINQVIAGAAAIGDSFQQAFKGLVSGAMTGQQALAAFFKGVGDHFLDMASKMIAKLIEIWILETVLGFISGAAAGGGQGGGVSGVQTNAPGVSGLATTSMAMAANGAYWPGGFQAFADGGIVTRPTMGLIGEGGEPEYVIPASKMRSAMGRYAAGARGSSVIPSSGGDSAAAGGGVSTLAPIDVRYTVERINNVDYVTADQFQAGLQQAAAQGARRGEQRTLATLRQNTAQRKRVGI